MYTDVLNHEVPKIVSVVKVVMLRIIAVNSTL